MQNSLNVALMGVFIAQALTVILGLSVVLLSPILLGVVASAARKRQLRAARVVLQPARADVSDTDGSIRSVIDVGKAAPSRAPPSFDPQATFDPRTRLDDLADASAG